MATHHDEEWSRSATNDRLLFMIDTGDIIKDGQHADQFRRLGTILEPADRLAYFVGVGNHEVKNNTFRDNAAVALGYLDPQFSTDRMCYRKDVGRIRFLFLDTNDLIYGDAGRERSFERAGMQMDWLESELARDDRGPDAVTVVVMHHPFVMSSSKHRGMALRLWNEPWSDRYLPDLLMEGGVDVVLTGHTHTFERFVLEKDGRRMHVINASGRPRGFFTGSRRAKDIQGREIAELRESGWERLSAWQVSQEDAMADSDEEANQFALVTVGQDGSLTMEVYFLDERTPEGVRRDPPVRIE